MSREYDSVQTVKESIALRFEIDVNDIKSDESLVVKIYETLNEKLKEDKNKQHSFKFKNNEGKEVKFVATPFRSGFDCWLALDNGYCIRI